MFAIGRMAVAKPVHAVYLMSRIDRRPCSYREQSSGALLRPAFSPLPAMFNPQ
ncbi:hypothetical protein [Pseudomonas sp. NFIX28]|uniref:hypothetical protein n=1 Tax=Pseudomonas sp. NFIX28 TaxID=1566235 RepID=UPI001587A454|nr:hypothetical protein [Pseudomonas sp. NFIX28]